MPAIDNVKLEVYVTTMTSVSSMKKAINAPSIILNAMSSITSIERNLNKWQLVISVGPTTNTQCLYINSVYLWRAYLLYK